MSVEHELNILRRDNAELSRLVKLLVCQRDQAVQDCLAAERREQILADRMAKVDRILARLASARLH